MSITNYGPAWLTLAIILMIAYCVYAPRFQKLRNRPYDWEVDGL